MNAMFLGKIKSIYTIISKINEFNSYIDTHFMK